jgi:hypothetical protein
MRIIQNDGGFLSSGIDDCNNCTVMALAIAADIPYQHADELCKSAGRKRKKGVDSRRVIFIAQQSGIPFHRVLVCRKTTLQSFATANPKGRFYVRIKNHALSIIDGDIHEYGFVVPEYRVTDAWQLIATLITNTWKN